MNRNPHYTKEWVSNLTGDDGRRHKNSYGSVMQFNIQSEEKPTWHRDGWLCFCILCISPAEMLLLTKIIW